MLESPVSRLPPSHFCVHSHLLDYKCAHISNIILGLVMCNRKSLDNEAEEANCKEKPHKWSEDFVPSVDSRDCRNCIQKRHRYSLSRPGGKGPVAGLPATGVEGEMAGGGRDGGEEGRGRVGSSDGWPGLRAGGRGGWVAGKGLVTPCD